MVTVHYLQNLGAPTVRLWAFDHEVVRGFLDLVFVTQDVIFVICRFKAVVVQLAIAVNVSKQNGMRCDKYWTLRIRDVVLKICKHSHDNDLIKFRNARSHREGIPLSGDSIAFKKLQEYV